MADTGVIGAGLSCPGVAGTPYVPQVPRRGFGLSRAAMSKDRLRLAAYLEHIVEAIQRIERYSKDMDKAMFEANDDDAERTDAHSKP